MAYENEAAAEALDAQLEAQEAESEIDDLAIAQLPILVASREAERLYGPPALGLGPNLALERELIELSEKAIMELMALFGDEQLQLDLSQESLEDLDRLASTAFEPPPDEQDVLDAMTANWGAYVGRVLHEQLGGQWRFRGDLDHASLHFPRLDVEAFPFHVARRRIRLGMGDSLGGFYEATVGALTEDLD